jgi:hypothetical protein
MPFFGAKAPRDQSLPLPGSISICPPPPENKDAKATPEEAEPASGEEEFQESGDEGSREGNNERIIDDGSMEEEEKTKQ